MPSDWLPPWNDKRDFLLLVSRLIYAEFVHVLRGSQVSFWKDKRRTLVVQRAPSPTAVPPVLVSVVLIHTVPPPTPQALTCSFLLQPAVLHL